MRCSGCGALDAVSGPMLVDLAEDALPVLRHRAAAIARHRGLDLADVPTHVIPAPNAPPGSRSAPQPAVGGRQIGRWSDLWGRIRFENWMVASPIPAACSGHAVTLAGQTRPRVPYGAGEVPRQFSGESTPIADGFRAYFTMSG
jgi:hypothetical protein